MNTTFQEDLRVLPELLQQAMDLSLQYLENIAFRPVSISHLPISWPDLPGNGLGGAQTQKLFEQLFFQEIVASSGPRYWGFVTGGTTPAAFAGDWISTIFDQNTQRTVGIGDSSALMELQTFQNSSAPYLGNQGEQFSYLNLVPENSRRFRALPVWFTLMACGKDGYRFLIEQNTLLANELAEVLVETGFFNLPAPVRLNTVCFSIHPDYAGRIAPGKFQQCLHEEGTVFMTLTNYGGKPFIRAALVNYRTNSEDIGIAIESITSAIQKVLHQKM